MSQFFVMHWYEEVLEVCTDAEEAARARDRYQSRVPLFPVVVIEAESEAAAKTFLRARREAIDYPLRKPAPQTARLQDYIKAVQAGEIQAVQALLREAEESPELVRVIRSWQVEHGGEEKNPESGKENTL